MVGIIIVVVFLKACKRRMLRRERVENMELTSIRTSSMELPTSYALSSTNVVSSTNTPSIMASDESVDSIVELFAFSTPLKSPYLHSLKNRQSKQE